MCMALALPKTKKVDLTTSFRDFCPKAPLALFTVAAGVAMVPSTDRLLGKFPHLWKNSGILVDYCST